MHNGCHAVPCPLCTSSVMCQTSGPRCHCDKACICSHWDWRTLLVRMFNYPSSSSAKLEHVSSYDAGLHADAVSRVVSQKIAVFMLCVLQEQCPRTDGFSQVCCHNALPHAHVLRRVKASPSDCMRHCQQQKQCMQNCGNDSKHNAHLADIHAVLDICLLDAQVPMSLSCLVD